MARAVRTSCQIAIAGPAVNVVIAGILFAMIQLFGTLGGLTQIDLVSGSFLTKLLLINILADRKEMTSSRFLSNVKPGQRTIGRLLVRLGQDRIQCALEVSSEPHCD